MITMTVLHYVLNPFLYPLAIANASNILIFPSSSHFKSRISKPVSGSTFFSLSFIHFSFNSFLSNLSFVLRLNLDSYATYFFNFSSFCFFNLKSYIVSDLFFILTFYEDKKTVFLNTFVFSFSFFDFHFYYITLAALSIFIFSSFLIGLPFKTSSCSSIYFSISSSSVRSPGLFTKNKCVWPEESSSSSCFSLIYGYLMHFSGHTPNNETLFLIVNGSIPVWRPESITRAPVLKAALAIPA